MFSSTLFNPQCAWYSWCAPCFMLAPVMDKIAQEFEDKLQARCWRLIDCRCSEMFRVAQSEVQSEVQSVWGTVCLRYNLSEVSGHVRVTLHCIAFHYISLNSIKCHEEFWSLQHSLLCSVILIYLAQFPPLIGWMLCYTGINIDINIDINRRLRCVQIFLWS